MVSPDESNDRLGDAAADYLSRVDLGETPDRESLLAEYPDVAEGLIKFFKKLDRFDKELARAKAAAKADGIGSFLDSSVPAASSGARWSGSGRPAINGFKLFEELGGGSQGVVYKATQLGTNRTVALKVVRGGLFASPDARRRFAREVELIARLTHPNIVAVHDCGQSTGYDYYAMEYIDGESLDTYSSSRHLEVAETVRLFHSICRAVGYAHQNGVIHRDLKPSNVIIDKEGQAHILDFGLAKPTDDAAAPISTAVTQPGDFAGTWFYASPEQARKDPRAVDVRSDVYSLGVMLYEMLTDTLPYPLMDEPAESIAKHICHTAPTRPSLIRRDIDDDLETIILVALNKDPDRRYQSGAQFSKDVAHYLAGEVIDAKRDSHSYVLRKTIQRHRVPVAAAGIAVTALILFTVTISILYARAVTAQATTTARMEVVRSAEGFMIDKLANHDWSVNRVAEFAEAYPNLPEVRAWALEPTEVPVDLFARVVAGLPEDIVEKIRAGEGPGFDLAAGWLRDHDTELEGIIERSQTSRFTFGVQRTADTGLALSHIPTGLGPTSRLCDALVARALNAHFDDRTLRAVGSLEAARSIAQDLGDGSLLLHRIFSTTIRERICDAALAMMSPVADEQVPSAYVDWVLSDPPFVEFRPAMTLQRLRITQIIEEASFGHRQGGAPRLDLATLRDQLSPIYDESDEALERLRAVAESTSPMELLEIFDAYILDVETWDAIPWLTLKKQTDQVHAQASSRLAWNLIGPALGNHKLAFRGRARGNARRAAMVLFGHVSRYRHRQGRWPNRLVDAVEDHRRHLLIDPVAGQPFVYRLNNGYPTLYSVNEDRVDDGGINGPWGTPGTDVVFFPMSP